MGGAQASPSRSVRRPAPDDYPWPLAGDRRRSNIKGSHKISKKEINSNDI